MSTNKFIIHLAAELVNSVNNNYEDNYDFNRFGKAPELIKKPRSPKQAFISWINRKGFYNNFNNYLFSKKIESINYPLTDFIYLYSNLEDEYSKDLLIKIIAYRVLGYTKVKLPLSTPQFWNNQHLIESNQSKIDFIDIDFMNLRLPLTDLSFLGNPLKMYYTSLGINIDFIIKQYEFHREKIYIEAEMGDIVIDAGACYGDTALYFGDKVGITGQVHAFEFIPGNIKIFKKNLRINEDLGYKINLVPNPLWSTSGEEVFYYSNGPGSKVSLEEFEGYTNKTTTISIDDYYQINKLARIDFIKMDIEGAEVKALQGAQEIIKKFKPKLAIALYHSTNDFDAIPRFINELNLGYKLYLSHSTIYGEETMLFASIEK